MDDREQLKVWREAYFNLSPLVSDQEYDALKDKVSRSYPEDPEILAIGATPPVNSPWEKARHEIPMGSLSKVNSIEGFEKWADMIGKYKTDRQFNGEFFITHKVDGSSMELVYESGKLVRCVTRGDGVIGEDVTVNVKKIPYLPTTIPHKGTVIVRGEILMYKHTFEEKYAEEYANPRNTAAGKIRDRKNFGMECKDLVFRAYWMSDHPDRPDTMYELFSLLEKDGFSIPAHFSPGNVSHMKELFASETDFRDKVPYEIDGMVISINDLKLLDELGDINMRPRGQTAWKFDAEMGETEVVDVVWQVGPSGMICPVAKIKHVEIGGVVISSVSLHNLSIFRDLKLFRGCRVLVARRNDVIPYIEANLSLEAT